MVEAGDSAAPDASGPTVEHLLAGLGEAFDLDYRVPGGTLETVVRRQLEAIGPTELPRWGDAGSMTQVAQQGSDLLRFYYRPHLFPDMSPSLRLGHQLQFALLPRSLPPRSPLKIAAVLESYCHLSGDLLGWEQQGDELSLWIADISGHGIRAGLAAAVMRLLVDRLRSDRDPESKARELNEAMLAARNPDDPQPLFATAVFARIGPEGRGVYASAGHPPALLRAPGGTVTELAATGCPIGLLPDQRYERRSFELGHDDSLVLYTDGVTEAADSAGAEFGHERLRALLTGTSGAPIDIARAIYDEVNGHKNAEAFEDDLTFVVAQRRRESQ